jgi:protein involved in polysaccharide export with SLBB domain
MTHSILKSLPIAVALVLTAATTDRVAAQARDIPMVAGDRISVSVFGREDLSGEHGLDTTGRVALPLVGRIDAAGLSTEDLEQKLKSIYEETGFVDQPFVTVEVVQRQDVYVDGDVAVPGAVVWRSGLTVAQAVVLAGGRKEFRVDEIGAVLQAYRSQEEYEALQLEIAGLQAHEARLQAEMALSDAAFDHVALPEDDGSVNLGALAQVLGEGTPETALAVLSKLDVAQQQKVWAGAAGHRLIRFPETLGVEPRLESLRRTHEILLQDHLAINLASYSSLRLQAQASADRLDALRQRQAIISDTVAALGAQLQKILDLKDEGLVRAQDVLNAQTAVSEATSTQLEVLDSIAATEVERHRQELAIENFASALRTELQTDLEATRTQLLQAMARLGPARRAAEISVSYRQRDPGTEAPGPATFALVRRDVYGARDATVTEETLLMPGDRLVVTGPVPVQ